jgi:SagB-type dehydrogenase family enzyme
MRQVSLLILVSAFVFAGCNCPQKETKKEQKTEIVVPMELNSFETIKLLAPDTEGGIALLTAAQNRKSYREFAETNLSLKQLSEILWMANGVNREDGKRTVPSAMAMYPLETYAVLANGIYLYNPEAHELQPVVEGDYRNLSGLQPFVENAPLNLVFIANYEKYAPRELSEERSLYLAALDAGHCTQNVYLYCASEGLKSVVRAGAKEQELLEVLNLDEKHHFIVAHTVGY